MANLNFPVRLPTEVEKAGGFDLVIISATLEYLSEWPLLETARSLMTGSQRNGYGHVSSGGGSGNGSRHGRGLIITPSQMCSKYQLRTYTQVSLPPVFRQWGLKTEMVLKYGIWLVAVVKP
jgi:hypothetical protein